MKEMFGCLTIILLILAGVFGISYVFHLVPDRYLMEWYGFGLILTVIAVFFVVELITCCLAWLVITGKT